MPKKNLSTPCSLFGFKLHKSKHPITGVDTLLRAFFLAYAFSIVKAWGLIILPLYFGIMSIAICMKKKKLSINKFDLAGIIMSFGSR